MIMRCPVSIWPRAGHALTHAWRSFSKPGRRKCSPTTATFFSMIRNSVTPRPVQTPHPPVYMACVMSPESYEWAGVHGHRILTAPFFFTRFEDQQTRLALYHRALEKVGVEPTQRDVVGAYHLYCGDSDAEV